MNEERLEKIAAARVGLVVAAALKKIKGIIANEELTKEEKKKQIKEVKKQAHNRSEKYLKE